MEDVYSRFAKHLFTLEQAYPPREGLEEILKENFTLLEAEVALAFPGNLIPMQTVGINDIIEKVNLSREELTDVLEGLAQRGLLFFSETKEGEKGYALLQIGFGFSGTWFWKGEITPFAKKMAQLIDKYNRGRVLEQTYRTSKTLPNQFIPINKAVEPMLQAVYPYIALEQVVEQARVVAVAHCTCRMRAQLLGRGCDHLLEVCLKFDDLAEYLIKREIGREVTKQEALEIIKKAEEDGLVHFVDNALGDIKHNCNCCGCCCWALGPIKRREIPRDEIMATYFIRYTDEEECIGCGDCIEVCPVDALAMGNDFPIADEDWCIGCGLCIIKCPQSAVKLRAKSEQIPPRDFRALHEKIRQEKSLT